MGWWHYLQKSESSSFQELSLLLLPPHAPSSSTFGKDVLSTSPQTPHSPLLALQPYKQGVSLLLLPMGVQALLISGSFFISFSLSLFPLSCFQKHFLLEVFFRSSAFTPSQWTVLDFDFHYLWLQSREMQPGASVIRQSYSPSHCISSVFLPQALSITNIQGKPQMIETCSYGLNVSVPSTNSFVKNLIASMLAFENRDLRRWLGLRTEPSQMGLVPLWKRPWKIPELFLSGENIAKR